MVRIWPQTLSTKPSDWWESIEMQLVVNHASNRLENYGVHLTPLYAQEIFNDQTPLPLGISESLCGGGKDIFGNYTFILYLELREFQSHNGNQIQPNEMVGPAL